MKKSAGCASGPSVGSAKTTKPPEQGLPLADIARVMNVAEGTVKAHLFHALAKLRKTLEEHR